MTKAIVSTGLILAIFALPLAANAQTTGGTATGNAPNAPAAVQPVNKAGTAPAPAMTSTAPTAAAVANVLSADQSAKLSQFLSKEKKPSTKVTEKIAIGSILPNSVELYSFPSDLGVKSDYRYTIVNDHAALVEAKSHKIIQMIN